LNGRRHNNQRLIILEYRMVKKSTQNQEMVMAAKKMDSNSGKICGCMGTRHKLIGSCISCGRITCEMEVQKENINNNKKFEGSNGSNKDLPATSGGADSLGLPVPPGVTPPGILPPNLPPGMVPQDMSPDLLPPGSILCSCFTCNSPVCTPMSGKDLTQQGSTLDEDTLKAYRQKDKLLMFDKEHAKRTHVHDAQADYYETGTWLSEEEKSEMDKREQHRRDGRKPLNRKFKMAFDMAGRRIIEEIEEDGENVGDFNEKNAKSTEFQDDYYDYYNNRDNTDNDEEESDTKGITNDDMNEIEKKSLNNAKNRNEINEKNENEKNLKKNENESGLLDNEILLNNSGKTGDVYRFLRASMAEKAGKTVDVRTDKQKKFEKKWVRT